MEVNQKSQKIRKISRINSYIVNKIDGDQSIKRYLRYLTEAPLSQTSKDSSGVKVAQPNLINSLKIDSTEGKQVLWKGSFKEDMVEKEQTYIFVHTFTGSFKDIGSKLRVAINILIPSSRELLRYDEISRSLELSDLIIDLLDDKVIENDEYIDIGKVKLKCTNYDNDRLSNNSNVIRTTLLFEADIVTMGRTI